MPTYSQANRPMGVSTPLGPDVLLLQQFSGSEFLSRLFRFQLEMLAESSTDIAFDQILGQSVTVTLQMPDGSSRYINGIVNKFSQGERIPSPMGRAFFARYQAEIVPQLWLLTRKAQSRIFQQVTVPDILKQVLTGLSVDYQLLGTYKPRDYCVQYRETDFDFASRLMEEEGIYYFFTHADGSHKMVVADTPMSHPDVPGATTAIYEVIEGGLRKEDRVHSWEKRQEIRSGKYTLWDQCFELPGQNLEAIKPVLASVQVGTVSHTLKVAGNGKLELYDFPGGYAQRFDGISPGGSDRASDIQNIFQDNERTAAIRIQQEAARALSITGKSTCRQFTAGHKFTLERHFNADGAYVLTHVGHSATMGDTYTTGSDTSPIYENTFECIPIALPFKPAQATPRPRIEGTQTAVVVGNPGDEIFTDKYGRVKVQFPWDRQGKKNADSSCWVRVATLWAGKNWGMIHIPRVGQEVVVSFEEGDPDRPLIVGSVYNADMMPPFDLPSGKVKSGIKSDSTIGGGGYNEFTFDDTKGKEEITVHAQYDMDTTVEHDDTQTVHNNRTIAVDGTHTETVKKTTSITITEGTYAHDVAANTATYHVAKDLTENYDANQATTVQENQSLTVLKNRTIAVEGTHTETVTNDTSITVTDGNFTHDVASGTATYHVAKDINEIYDGNQITSVKNSVQIQSTDADIVLAAKTQLMLVCGQSSIVLKHDGTIEISGTEITLSATSKTTMGVGNQNVTCDTGQVATSGASITSSAVGKHTISGGLIMIN